MEEFSRIDARSKDAISFVASNLAKNVFHFSGKTTKRYGEAITE
jgi:hypothetical protein